MPQAQSSLAIGEGQFFASIDDLRRHLLPDESSNDPCAYYFANARAVTLRDVLSQLHAEGRLTPDSICDVLYRTPLAELAEWLKDTPACQFLNGAGTVGGSTLASLRQALYSFYRGVMAAREDRVVAKAIEQSWQLFNELIELHAEDGLLSLPVLHLTERNPMVYAGHKVVGIASTKQLERIFGKGPRPVIQSSKLILRVADEALPALYADAIESGADEAAGSPVTATVTVTF